MYILKGMGKRCQICGLCQAIGLNDNPVATSGASKVHLSRSPDIKTFTMAGSHTEIGTNDHEIEE